MSIGSSKGFALVAAVLAVLALATAVSVAALGGNGSGRSDQVKAGPAESVDGVKAVPSANNKKSDDVGVCAYSEAENKHHFKKVPKPKKEGKDAQSSSLVKELEKGGQVADSSKDCKELNAILADPPKGHEAEGGEDVSREDGPAADAPPAAIEGEESFGTSVQDQSDPQTAGQ